MGDGEGTRRNTNGREKHRIGGHFGCSVDAHSEVREREMRRREKQTTAFEMKLLLQITLASPDHLEDSSK